MRYLLLVLKLLCYVALAVVLAGLVAAGIVAQTGGCPRFDEAGVQCISPFYEQLGSFAMAVLLVSVFTGVPVILAIVGLVFLLRDLLRWRRARA
jgi:hypothetical protein